MNLRKNVDSPCLIQYIRKCIFESISPAGLESVCLPNELSLKNTSVSTASVKTGMLIMLQKQKHIFYKWAEYNNLCSLSLGRIGSIVICDSVWSILISIDQLVFTKFTRIHHLRGHFSHFSFRWTFPQTPLAWMGAKISSALYYTADFLKSGPQYF